MRIRYTLKLLIPAMICVFPGGSSAQTYHPLPDSNAIWIVVNGSSDCILSNTPPTSFYYAITGDTMIAGQGYSKVWRTRVFDGCPFHGSGYAGAFRNDTIAKQVLIVPPDSMEAQLLFDFNAQVGDTIRAYRGPGGWVEEQVVTNIDSILILGTYRTRWTIQGDYGPEEIIEGIGSTSGLTERINSVDSGTYLHCLSVDSAAVYESQPGDCDVNLGLEEVPSSALLNIFPNPSTGSITIRTTKGMAQGDLRVLDLSGRLVLSLTLRGTEQKIDVSRLSPGMYAVDLRANGIPLALGELIIE